MPDDRKFRTPSVLIYGETTVRSNTSKEQSLKIDQVTLICPLCACCRSKRVFTQGGGRLVYRCVECGLFFYSVRPSASELDSYYSIYSYNRLIRIPYITLVSMLDVLLEFERNIKIRPIRLLDYGCGQGDFLLLAQSRGWIVTGIEFSRSARDICNSRGLKSIFTNHHQLYFNSEDYKFNLITSFEVLEHLVDPHSFFEFSRSSVSPGGYVMVTTPNANSLSRLMYGWGRNLCYPEHINAFTSGTFKFISKRFSMRLDQLETRGLRSRFLLAMRERIKPRITLRNSEGYTEIGQNNYNVEVILDRKSLYFSGYVLVTARFFLNLFLKIVLLGETLRVVFKVEEHGGSR